VILADDCTGECLKSGPWGLAIILVLCVACYFLFRSMSKHIKKVREQAAQDEAARQAEQDARDEAAQQTEDEQVDQKDEKAEH